MRDHTHVTRRSIFSATAAAALLVLAFVATRVALERPGEPSAMLAATPTSSAPGPSPLVQPSALASASPGAAASPPAAATTRYVSAAMGYSIELRPPWHRAICGSSRSGPLDNREGSDIFIAIPDRDFRLTDVGPNTDNIDVFARANPNGLTYRDWKTSQVGGSVGETIDDVTFAGRPALLVTYQDSELFLIADTGYMYAVRHQPRSSSTPSADRAAIVRSFRFLTADDLRAARASATPSPAPRTVDAVADVLAEGFSKRDVSILARVISPRCVSQGSYQAGASSSDPQTYLDSLRDRFASGLTVDVRPRPITTRGEFPGTSFVRSTWRESGQPDRDSDLMVVMEGGTAYWNGIITFFGPRPP